MLHAAAALETAATCAAQSTEQAQIELLKMSFTFKMGLQCVLHVALPFLVALEMIDDVAAATRCKAIATVTAVLVVVFAPATVVVVVLLMLCC